MAAYAGAEDLISVGAYVKGSNREIDDSIDAFEAIEPMSVSAVQLVGAMGARIMEYDGHDLVSRMTEKLGGGPISMRPMYATRSSGIVNSWHPGGGTASAPISPCQVAPPYPNFGFCLPAVSPAST
jgi:hypothetical protein